MTQKVCDALRISSTGASHSLWPMVKAYIPAEVSPFINELAASEAVSEQDGCHMLWTKDLRHCPEVLEKAGELPVADWDLNCHRIATCACCEIPSKE